MPGQRDKNKPSWGDRFFGLAEVDTSNEAGDERKKKWAGAGAGLELAVGIGMFGGLGYLGDRQMGTLPWMTITGSLMGMAAGLYLLIKTVRENS